MKIDDRRVIPTPARCPIRHPYGEAEYVEGEEATCILGHKWKITALRYETDAEMKRRQKT